MIRSTVVVPALHNAVAENATLDLACELIARRSPTPDDGGCQEIIKARLGRIGFRCETLVSNGVTNLWARRGSERPVVCFAGHTDVVPTGPLADWHSDPFEPDDTRRIPLRPRRRGHEELAGRRSSSPSSNSSPRIPVMRGRSRC